MPEVPPPTQPTRLQTSFVAQTPEVRTMRELLLKNKAPTFWYELAQNALDYNNWDRGSPGITVFLPDGRTMLLPEYLTASPAGKPVRIEFSNFIRGAQGMSPDDVAHIVHRGGEETLGEHGRGLSVASTLAVADKLCRSIEYRSSDKNGPWIGEGVMELGRTDQREPHFALVYNRVPAGQQDTESTVVAVHDPAVALWESLISLPNYFLPANARYQNSRFQGSEIAQKVPNIFTVSVGEVAGANKTFIEGEVRGMGIGKQKEVSDGEPPRVEILDRALVGEDRGIMFVGGLRVRYRAYMDKDRPILPWSFYGFERADYYYKIQRSKDSSLLEGNPSRLIASVLRRCDVPSVHLAILHASNKEGCLEGSVPAAFFVEGMTGEAKSALKTAWQSFLQETGLPNDTLVTSHESMLRRAQSEGRQTVLLQSEAYVAALSQIGGAATVEDTFQITKPTKHTGETLYTRKKSTEVQREDLIRDMLYAIAKHHGRVVSNGLSQNILTVRLDLPEEMPDLLTFYDIPSYLRNSLLQTATLLGEEADCALSIDNGTETISFGAEQTYPFDEPIAHIDIKRGVGKTSSRPGMELNIVLLKSPSLNYNLFVRKLDQQARSFTNPDGSFNSEAYMMSLDHDSELVRDEIEQRRRELEAITARARQAKRALVDVVGMEQEEPGKNPSVREVFTMLPREAARSLLGVLSPEATYRGLSTSYFVEESSRPETSRSFEIAFMERSTGPSIKLKVANPGRHSFPCPVGYEPIGYHHSTNPKVQFLRSPNGVFAYNLEGAQQLKDFTIYYQAVDRSMDQPADADNGEPANLFRFRKEWRDLLAQLQQDDTLSQRKKLSIIASAWQRAFTYTAVLRGGASDERKVVDAQGNCVDCAEGFAILARSINIPARVRGGTLGTSGRIVRGGGHAWNQVFLAGSWFDIDPQIGKDLRTGSTFAKISEKYHSLIREIPAGGFHIGQLKELVRQETPGLMLKGTGAIGAIALAQRLISSISIRVPMPEIPMAEQLRSIAETSGAVATGPGGLLAAGGLGVAIALYLRARAYRAGLETGKIAGRQEERQAIQDQVNQYLAQQEDGDKEINEV